MYLRDCGYPLVSVFVVLDRDTVGAISAEILLVKLLYNKTLKQKKSEKR